MTKYRKRPVEIEAMRFDGENAHEIEEWAGGKDGKVYPVYTPGGGYLRVKTLEGELIAIKGDWVLKGVANEFYPCKPHIFKLTYEEVKE